MKTLNGWLVLDKPLGITSAHAVSKVKRLLKPGKIGHAGTLDPLASGILPLALGEATKTVQYAFHTSKAYRFAVSWGERRDTDDAEGKVVETSEVRPEKSHIVTLCHRFIGEIWQAPPAYSAIKIAGTRAYDLARQGETVIIEPRKVRIDVLSLLEWEENCAVFEVMCGKGTYIRSLARDMAEALGTVGYVSYLRRLQVGPFTESHAISLESLEKIVHKGDLATVLHPVESVLDDIPAREVNSALATRLTQGQPLALPLGALPDDTSIMQVYSEGRLVALCKAEQGMMKPVRVFNLE